MKKRSKTIISTLLIAILMLGTVVTPVSAASSGGKKGYVTVSVKQDYAQVQQVLKQINRERKKKGLKTVKLDKKLSDLAVRRAAESAIYMDDNHTRPDGKDCLTVGKSVSRENWAGRSYNGSKVVRAWMRSKGHRKNVLANNVSSIGVGFVTTGNSEPYCVLLMSRSKAKKVLKKSTGYKNYNIKVTAKTKYLKKSYFRINAGKMSETYDPYEPYYEEYVTPGETAQCYVEYNSKYCGLETSYTRLSPSSFTWKSSNSAVASITSKGKLTAKKVGEATITATMKKAPKHKIRMTIYIEEDEVD